jgi:Ran-binding protein 1
MSDATEPKPTPSADQTASSEPRLAADETKLATNPIGDESKEAPATTATSASTVTSTVTNAAAGVKDSVFSMFGGGGKKEKKVEEDDDAKDEPSGSSKAKKDDDDEVGSLRDVNYRPVLTNG